MNYIKNFFASVFLAIKGVFVKAEPALEDAAKQAAIAAVTTVATGGNPQAALAAGLAVGENAAKTAAIAAASDVVAKAEAAANQAVPK